MLLDRVIITNVIGELLAVVAQGVADVDGQRQTHPLVKARLGTEIGHVHGAERVDEIIVACNLRLVLVDELPNRQQILLKVLILLGGLVAGISQVEHIFGLL